MSFIGNEQARLWRRTEGGIDPSTGLASSDSYSDQGLINITVTPVEGEDLETMPSGENLSDWKKGFTTSDIEIVDDREDQDGDVLEYSGQYFKVKDLQVWPKIIPHRRVLLRRIERPFSPT